MDICYACTLYPPAIGGAQIHLHRLARQVQAQGHGVRVLTCSSRNRTDWLRLSTIAPEPFREYAHEGIRVTQLGYSGRVRRRLLPWMLAYYAAVPAAARRIARLISSEIPWPGQPPALVHVSRVGREFLAVAALDYARRQDVPFVLTPNHHPRWHGYLYRAYDHVYQQADAVIALTEAEKEMLVRQKGLHPERIHVTGIGPVLSENFSAERFRQKFQIPGRFVLYLGQQLRYKGVGAVVEAAPHVWRRHPDARFVFIGPPSAYSQKLFSRVRDNRLVNLGSVDLETKTSALAACELLCLPSSQESFGGVFVEAWAHRKAVVGGRIPPIAAVIDEGRDGLLSSQSPTELAAAIERLLSDSDECAAMGQAGWEKVQRRFTWEKLAKQTVAIYQSLDAASGAPRDAAGLPCLAGDLEVVSQGARGQS